MNIICNDARKLQLVSTDSAKKELAKSDGLAPRYKQPCGVGVHVDISTHRQEGVKKGATCPCKVCGGCREKRGYCWLPDSTATAQSTAETRTKLAQQQVEVGPTMYVEYTCRNFLLPLSVLLLS